MKPGEWMTKNLDRSSMLQISHPHLAWYITAEDRVMYAKIIALLEAVEDTHKTDLEDDIDFMEAPDLFGSVSILCAALALKEKP